MEIHENRGTDLSSPELIRYARHLALPEIGLLGQKKLKNSSVLCIGCGGLGSPLLLYLAAAGIGHIGIVDSDVVEDSNLQRQIIHGISWLGKTKITSARARILEINPFCQVDIFETMLNNKNALEIIKTFDLVCDCTDNFPSRYLINDACVLLGKPNIYGSIARFEGQVTVFNLDGQSPNYRDLVPTPPPLDLVPSCAEGGVVGVLPGLIGTIQATEVIKIITGAGTTLDGRLLIFDALKMTFRELALKAGATGKGIDRLINYEKFCQPKGSSKETFKGKSISAHGLNELIQQDPENIILLDVRELHESNSNKINGAYLIPLSQIKNGNAIEEVRKLSYGRLLYVYCQSGKRSKKALEFLQESGIEGVNLIGGINTWNEEFPTKY